MRGPADLDDLDLRACSSNSARHQPAGLRAAGNLSGGHPLFSGVPVTSLPPQPLSPLDGRYRPAVSSLADYLSEAGLKRARVEGEVEWLIALTDPSLVGSGAG